MKKNLIIIGCYLNSDLKKSIIKENINTLKSKFDILLTSHYPIDSDIQQLVNYSFYNYNNDIKTDHGYFTWHKNEAIYYERHHKHSINISYAVYNLIYNAINIAKSIGYDDLFYIEGDILISKTDINKILQLKLNTLKQNKSACFFHSDVDFWDCQLFYSKIDFLLKKLIDISNFSEFETICARFNINPSIEHLLYKLLYNESLTRRIDMFIIDYISNSKTNLTTASDDFNEELNRVHLFVEEGNNSVTYDVTLIKDVDSSEIFLYCYKQAFIKETDINIIVKINDTLVYLLNTYNDYCIKMPKTIETFNLKVYNNKNDEVANKNVTKEYILNLGDFIKRFYDK